MTGQWREPNIRLDWDGGMQYLRGSRRLSDSGGMRGSALKLCLLVLMCTTSVTGSQLHVAGSDAELRSTAAQSISRSSQIDSLSTGGGYKWPVVPTAGIKYYIYDPQQFKMYSRCQQRSTGFDTSMKHSLDLLFVRKMIEEMGSSVPPEEAEIFVVPVLMSQSYKGRCGSNSENVRDLIDKMESSEWFRRRRGADHFIVADHFGNAGSRSLGQLPKDWKVVFAHFECSIEEINGLTRAQQLTIGYRSPRFPHRQQSNGCLATGYSTYLALNKIGAIDSTSPPFIADQLPHQRQHDVFFIAGDTAKHPHAYRTRKEFVCSWLESSDVVKSRFFFHLAAALPMDCKGIATRRTTNWRSRQANSRAQSGFELKPSEAMRTMADSRFFLQMHGDTVTTDRLFNMFDTLTIPVIIDMELPHLLSQMPFNDGTVPWEDLFVQVPSTEWKRSPAQSVVDAIDRLSPADREAKYRLLQRHAPDVSYAADGTRAHRNLLAAAWKKMQTTSARQL